jgi:putative PIN family toxin of toxin-antitoxin system
MKVFLDTNVLAGGFGARGICADVIREVFSSHDLILSEGVLQELEKALRTKFKVPTPLSKEILDMLREDARMTSSKPLTSIAIKDSKDIPILSSAINGQADIFITGDKELLNLEKVGTVRILSPRGFWETIKSGQQ